MAQTSPVWGYIAVDDPQGDDRFRLPGNILVLPYSSGFHEWPLVKSGLPEKLIDSVIPHDDTNNETIDNSNEDGNPGSVSEYDDDDDSDEEKEVPTKGVKWMWGDDGIICWEITGSTGSTTKAAEGLNQSCGLFATKMIGFLLKMRMIIVRSPEYKTLQKTCSESWTPRFKIHIIHAEVLKYIFFFASFFLF